jgi:hypothetical protein
MTVSGNLTSPGPGEVGMTQKFLSPDAYRGADDSGIPSSRTREEWLLRLADALRPSFQVVGHPLPNQLRITCGWPSKAALARVHRTIGECWPPSASADQTVEIFISPCLGSAVEASETLVHELVHAVGVRGHRKDFSEIAKTVGLKKPWRATTATPELRDRLNALILRIGPYPHATLDRSLAPNKKDGTRMRKLVCPYDGYTVRTTAKWISVGMPSCPCGAKMRTADQCGGFGAH